jgi:hypothetical protein
MPNTDSTEVVTNYIYQMMQAVAETFSPEQIQDVFYGDQTLLSKTPAICVVPGVKHREFHGASLQTMNTFETLVYVYYCKLQDVQLNTHGCVALADAIEKQVHSDITLGGNVISILCEQNEPGIATKNGDLMMAARLQFHSQSRTRLP